MNKIKTVIWGLAILTLGVIFGGNAIGLFNIDLFFDGWWTLFIIIPSAIAFITEKEKFSNFAFLSAGVILLLAAQDVFSYEVAWKAILAVVLILLGIFIIFKSLYHGKNAKEVEKKIKESKNDGAMDSQTAIFSGSDKAYRNEAFSGSNLTAVFGGVELDLRDAVFNKDTVIKAFAMFGGIDIKVPDNVQIKIKSCMFFGGVSDDRKDTSNKGKYTIYLEAAGGFGGVSISDKIGTKK